MTDRPTASLTSGLVIEEQELLAVQLKSGKGSTSLAQILTIPIEKDETNHVKPLYIGKTEKAFQSILNKSLIVTGLNGSEVLIRDLTIQLTKEKDIDQVLEFQTEPLLPFPVDEGVVDRMISGKGLDHTGLTVCAVKEQLLSSHINLWHEVGVEPEVISCSQVALGAFSKQFSDQEGLHYVLHLGYTETICLLINEGVVLSSQVIQLGVENLKKSFNTNSELTDKELDKAFIELDFSSLSHKNLKEQLEILKIEVTKRFFSLAKQYPGQEIDTVLITGKGAELNRLAEELNSAINKTLITPTTKKRFDLTSQELQKYAIPLGYALQALPKTKNQINFRQKDFAYPYPWKRLKKPIAVYLALSLGLAASILAFGNTYINHKEDNLRKEYLEILSLMNKPFSQVETDIKKKNPQSRTFNESGGLSMKNMSQRELNQRIALIENEIKDTPDTFPLLPNTPRVSDFLAWISSHPHIANTEDEASSRKIVLEGISYKMVKRPDANKKKERYQVKVELEFSTSTPRYAREFHDILLAPNEMVDPNEDVKWNAERGKYRASFFLKDRTIYPTGKRK